MRRALALLCLAGGLTAALVTAAKTPRVVQVFVVKRPSGFLVHVLVVHTHREAERLAANFRELGLDGRVSGTKLVLS